MATQEKVFKAGVQREPGWLYYLSGGDLWRTRMVRGGQAKKASEKPEIVLKTDVKREKGYIYFLDKQGDVARCLTSGGQTKKQNDNKFYASESSAKKKVAKPKIKVEMLAVNPPPQAQVPTGENMELIEKKTGKHGDLTSYIKGTKILHKEDGPAHVMYSGSRKEWRRFGILHRDGGLPAVEDGNTEQYWVNGLQHRVGGAASISKGSYGYKEYYLFGENYSKPQYEKIVADKKLLKQMEEFVFGKQAATTTEKSKDSMTQFIPLFAAAAGLAGAGFLAGRGGAKEAIKAAVANVKKEQVVEARV